MSEPVRDADLVDGPPVVLDAVDVREGRRADVGGLDVVRVLPTKGRRTVGAWCFVDLMGPSTWTTRTRSRSGRTRTPASRRSPGCSRARRCTPTRSARSRSSGRGSST